MNREQFLHSIKSSDIESSDIVINFFDQYMLLYDLIDNVNNVSIISSDKSNISFRLDFDDEQSNITMRNKLINLQYVTIFESFYNIFFEVISNTSTIIKFTK